MTVSVEGARLNLTTPLYVDNNRYYLPLRETVSLMDGSLTVADNVVHFDVHGMSVTINTATGDYTAGGRTPV